MCFWEYSDDEDEDKDSESEDVSSSEEEDFDENPGDNSSESEDDVQGRIETPPDIEPEKEKVANTSRASDRNENNPDDLSMVSKASSSSSKNQVVQRHPVVPS